MATIRSMAALEVGDPAVSHAFYKSLGFGTLGEWFPDNLVTIIVQKGDVTVLLQKSEKPAVNQGLGVYIYVDDADALHADLTAKGTKGLSPMEDMFYGCREFGIHDPDGHELIFGTNRGTPPHANGLGPDRGEG